MKRLMLLRHAKSSNDNSSLTDFERPLNERGLAQSPFMGKLIASRGMLPEMIVTSPATRAIETARLFKESSQLRPELAMDKRIYDAYPETLRQVAREFPNEHLSIMMVGHNPGFEDFLTLLTGVSERIPTAAIAVIDLDIHEWSEVDKETGELVELIYPRDMM